MRERENVVEALVLISWDYLIKPAIFWWTYPFLRAVLPWWRREWEKYRSATLREREEPDPAPVDLHRVTFVDQSTPQGKPARYEEIPDEWTTQRSKTRVRVRRHQPITPDSLWRYVSYTFPDGEVKWGVERDPDKEMQVGWVSEEAEKPGMERAYIVEDEEPEWVTAYPKGRPDLKMRAPANQAALDEQRRKGC